MGLRLLRRTTVVDLHARVVARCCGWVCVVLDDLLPPRAEMSISWLFLAFLTSIRKSRFLVKLFRNPSQKK
jgi:hypothetical protein